MISKDNKSIKGSKGNLEDQDSQQSHLLQLLWNINKSAQGDQNSFSTKVWSHTRFMHNSLHCIVLISSISFPSTANVKPFFNYWDLNVGEERRECQSSMIWTRALLYPPKEGITNPWWLEIPFSCLSKGLIDYKSTMHTFINQTLCAFLLCYRQRLHSRRWILNSCCNTAVIQTGFFLYGQDNLDANDC